MLDILFGCLDDLQKCPISKQPWVLYNFLHFAWGVDDSKCIVVTRVCVSVCLSAAVRPHYCTDPGVTWGRGKGCPLVVHCWADLQSAHGLRCYGNNANPSLRGVCARCWLVTGGWRSRSQHCAPYIASGRGSLAGDWPSTGGVLNITAAAWTVGFQWWRSGNIMRTQNVREYMLVLALCLVIVLFSLSSVCQIFAKLD